MTDTKVITNGAHGPLKGMLKSLFSLTKNFPLTNLVYIIRICEFDANPKFSMATKANNVTSSDEIQNSLFSRNHLVV
jgi:hypothetical protein